MKRNLLLVNAGFRMAYGIGGLLSPAAMGKLQLAADTPERPDARLFVRGFSAHQIGVATLGLAQPPLAAAGTARRTGGGGN